MQLPNPGIGAVSGDEMHGKIVSIHGFDAAEWTQLVVEICRRYALYDLKTKPMIEFNLSCPNVDHPIDINEVQSGIDNALARGCLVIAKLPPVRWLDYAFSLYCIGVRHFHCCNTIPTPGGGMSGKPLMQYSLWAIKDLRETFGADVDLIGGGGITSIADVIQYMDAGADRCALGSMLFNPFNWRKVERMREALNVYCCEGSTK